MAKDSKEQNKPHPKKHAGSQKAEPEHDAVDASKMDSDGVSDGQELDESKPISLWKFAVALIIIIGLFTGVILFNKYQAASEKEKNQYNGFDFTQAQGGLWITRVEVRGQPYDMPFYNHPTDLEDIIVARNVTGPIYSKPSEVVISVDPEAPSKVVVAGVEIARITGTKYDLFNIPTTSALSKPAATKMDIPVVSCGNATRNRVVIQFVQGNENVIAAKDNCVVLQYVDINDSVRVADRYAYMLLKVMN